MINTNVRNPVGPRPRSADGLSTTDRCVGSEIRSRTFTREIRLSGNARVNLDRVPDALFTFVIIIVIVEHIIARAHFNIT
jgi:hypothetical protein